jgi:RNA polymerase-associated protein CTR9
MNGVLEIPLTSHTGEEEFLEVEKDNLPEAAELIYVLKAEKSPLSVWLHVAKTYLEQGQSLGLCQILSAATEPENAKLYSGSTADKISCLTTLSAYYLQLAENEKDRTQRESYIEQAINYNNRTGQLDMNNLQCWLGRIVVGLIKGEFEAAKKSIEFVLKEHPACVPAKLGLACIYYNSGEYYKALEIYRECLKLNPGGPAELRLGIGQCLLKLGRVDLARKALQRTLNLKPDCAGALVALGTLEINRLSVIESQGVKFAFIIGSNEKDGLLKGLRHIKKAYELEPKNSLVLNILADHFFFKKEYSKSYSFALAAVENSEALPVKALSHYYLGRLFQLHGDFTSAFQHFYRSCSLDSHLLPAQYGLGQMYLYRNDHDNARHYLEKVLDVCKDNYECTKLLAHLYFTKSPGKAYKLIKKVTEAFENDAEAWVDRAVLAEHVDIEDALLSYATALKIYEIQVLV